MKVSNRIGSEASCRAGWTCRVALAAAATLLASATHAQLTLRVTVPANTPPNDALFVAGSFNGWNPASPQYRLAKEGDAWTITLPPTVRGGVEFKFTRGAWDSAEADSAGRGVDNRTFVIPATGAATYEGRILAWVKPGTRPARAHTARASVQVLDTAFAMPQLGRTRRIWIYLPPDYATSGKRYPVLYMHDGQNLFDAATSYAGEWGIDESLDSLAARGDRGVIVVGIDNGSEQRMNEYSPWRHPQSGGGEGDRYVQFLVQTLKPFIDRRFRTLPDREHTGVMGSSMGGLISLAAAFRHPEVFGRVGVFSPSLWFNDSVYVAARALRPVGGGPRFYFASGGSEGPPGQPDVVVRAQQAMVDSLVAAIQKVQKLFTA